MTKLSLTKNDKYEFLNLKKNKNKTKKQRIKYMKKINSIKKKKSKQKYF